MIRVNYIQQALHLFIFLIIQIPLLHKFVFLDRAFVFFYVGFVLFLPYGISKGLAMVIGFLSGLLVDVFSNTPGIHASACIFIAFIKDFWYDMLIGNTDDDVYLDWNELGLWGSITYLLPLIFFHHFIIFSIENGGFNSFGILFAKIVFSTTYTFFIIFGLSFLTAPKTRRI